MLHPFYLGQTKAKHEQIEPTISDPVTSFGNLIYYNASWPHPAEVQNINSVNLYVDASVGGLLLSLWSKPRLQAGYQKWN